MDRIAAGQAGGGAVQRHLAQLALYIRNFEKSLKTARAITDEVAAPPSPSPP